MIVFFVKAAGYVLLEFHMGVFGVEETLMFVVFKRLDVFQHFYFQRWQSLWFFYLNQAGLDMLFFSVMGTWIPYLWCIFL